MLWIVTDTRELPTSGSTPNRLILAMEENAQSHIYRVEVLLRGDVIWDSNSVTSLDGCETLENQFKLASGGVGRIPSLGDAIVVYCGSPKAFSRFQIALSDAQERITIRFSSSGCNEDQTHPIRATSIMSDRKEIEVFGISAKNRGDYNRTLNGYDTEFRPLITETTSGSIGVTFVMADAAPAPNALSLLLELDVASGVTFTGIEPLPTVAGNPYTLQADTIQ